MTQATRQGEQAMYNQDRELYAKIDRVSGITKGFEGTVVLTTAVRLELFTLLDKKPLTAKQVAAQR